MQLTEREREMLDGKYGYPLQKSMEILVAVGECYDAPRMVSVKSAHLVGCNPMTLGKAGVAFIQELADKGGKFTIPLTTNPACLNPWDWKKLNFDEEFYRLNFGEELQREQIAVSGAVAKMGGFLCLTCIPYLIGHAPRLGEHVSWSESSATIFANGVLGARTSRESGPTVIAAALTGVTPEYSFHLPENRHGKLKITVHAELKGTTQFATLGFFTGRIAEEKVPVFVGIPPSVSTDELKSLGAAMASSGSVAHYHIVGITPEAHTEREAFGSKKPGLSDVYEFGPRELKETERYLSRTGTKGASLVVLGCPHASIHELKYYAGILSKHKIKSDVWITTSRVVRAYAERLGYIDAIQASGAKVLTDTCVSLMMPRGYLKRLGYTVVVTNSAKMANAIPTTHDVSCYYGDLEHYIVDAMSKAWVER